MIMAQTYVFCLMTVILSIPFIYRYFVICRYVVLSLVHASLRIFRGQVLTANQFVALLIVVCAVPLVYPLNYAVFIWPSAARILENEQIALENATCQDTGQVALYTEDDRVVSSTSAARIRWLLFLPAFKTDVFSKVTLDI